MTMTDTHDDTPVEAHHDGVAVRIDGGQVNFVLERRHVASLAGDSFVTASGVYGLTTAITQYAQSLIEQRCRDYTEALGSALVEYTNRSAQAAAQAAVDAVVGYVSGLVPSSDAMVAGARQAALDAVAAALPSLVQTIELSTRRSVVERDKQGNIVKITTSTVDG